MFGKKSGNSSSEEEVQDPSKAYRLGEKHSDSSKAMNQDKKPTVQQRIDQWDVSSTVLESILNVLIAIIIFGVLLSWALFTMSLEKHILSVVVIPLVAYFALSSPGLKLRMRELWSMLAISDAFCIISIFLICFYMDHEFSTGAPYLIEKILLSLFGIFGFASFCCRARLMYSLILPFALLYTVFFVYFLGYSLNLAIFFGLLEFMIFLCGIYGHTFYFGIGRICVEGKFVQTSEEEARALRMDQKISDKAEKRSRKYSKFEGEDSITHIDDKSASESSGELSDKKSKKKRKEKKKGQ